MKQLPSCVDMSCSQCVSAWLLSTWDMMCFWVCFVPSMDRIDKDPLWTRWSPTMLHHMHQQYGTASYCKRDCISDVSNSTMWMGRAVSTGVAWMQKAMLQMMRTLRHRNKWHMSNIEHLATLRHAAHKHGRILLYRPICHFLVQSSCTSITLTVDSVHRTTRFTVNK